MENENENLNSPNENEVIIDDTDSPDALKEKFGQVSEKYKKTLDLNRQLFERAKKAEGFEKDAEGNWTKTIIKESKKESKAKEAKQSDEIDYGKRAFLLASGIKMDEISFFEEQMQISGVSEPEKLLANPYFSSALKEFRDKNEALKATPPSGGRGGGESLKSKADYWIDKGEFPPNTPENQQLRQDIVNEKMRRIKSSNSNFTKQSVVYGKGR